MNGSTYHQLTIFLTIVQEGSIRGAARKLELSAPSVSQALKQLEQHLGLPLITRTTRQMELTDAGRQLFEQSEPMTRELNGTLESIRDLGQVPSGKVRLTVPRFVYQLLIRPIYAQFCQTYPQIQLEISVTDAVVNLIGEGFDMGIRFGDLLEEGMVSVPLTPPIEEALVVSPAYRDKHGVPETPTDLHHHRLIQYRFITSNQLAPLYLTDNGNRIEVDMPLALIVNDTDMMVDAAEQGLGIGRIVAPMVNEQLASKCLLPILKPYWFRYPGLRLYFPQHSQKARRTRVLIDFLREHAVRAWADLK